MAVVATYESDRWFIDDLCSRLPGRLMTVDTPYSNKQAKEQIAKKRGKKRPKRDVTERDIEKKQAKKAKRKERRKQQKEMWKQRRAEAELRKSDPARIALREKLLAKINALKAQRMPKADTSEEMVKLAAARRRKKRKLAEKRAEEIRQKKRALKKAYRERKKEEKRAKSEKEGGTEEVKGSDEEKSKKRPREEEPEGEEDPDTKLEFSLLSPRKKSKGLRASLNSMQDKEKYLETLPKERAEKIKEDMRYKNAMIRAAGGAVRDDKQLLKKAMKRKQKQKEKSAKEWKRREKNVLRMKQEKQATRKKNILAKIALKKEKILSKRMPNELVP